MTILIQYGNLKFFRKSVKHAGLLKVIEHVHGMPKRDYKLNPDHSNTNQKKCQKETVLHCESTFIKNETCCFTFQV